MLYIGVDLGGTGIKAGVVNERGEILSKGSTPTMKERPYQAIIRDIAALCEDVAKQANVAMADIAAIGVGVLCCLGVAGMLAVLGVGTDATVLVPLVTLAGY